MSGGSVPDPHVRRTDRDLAEIDVPALLRDGLATAGPTHHELFGDARIAAAVAADRLGVQPRSLTFLAEVVRRGGIGYAAGLPEPLPGTARTALARNWLEAASTAPADTRADEEFARWLDAVAVILGVRQHTAPPPEVR
jgi:hypothetical protein